MRDGTLVRKPGLSELLGVSYAISDGGWLWQGGEVRVTGPSPTSPGVGPLHLWAFITALKLAVMVSRTLILGVLVVLALLVAYPGYLVAWLSILVTGRQSASVHGYVLRVECWIGSAAAEILDLRGRYPVSLDVTYPERQSRVSLMLVRPFVAYGMVAGLLLVLALWIPRLVVFLLFGRRPKRLAETSARAFSWVLHCHCYLMLLTDQVPLFSAAWSFRAASPQTNSVVSGPEEALRRRVERAEKLEQQAKLDQASAIRITAGQLFLNEVGSSATSPECRSFEVNLRAIGSRLPAEALTQLLDCRTIAPTVWVKLSTQTIAQVLTSAMRAADGSMESNPGIEGAIQDLALRDYLRAMEPLQYMLRNQPRGLISEEFTVAIACATMKSADAATRLTDPAQAVAPTVGPFIDVLRQLPGGAQSISEGTFFCALGDIAAERVPADAAEAIARYRASIEHGCVAAGPRLIYQVSLETRRLAISQNLADARRVLLALSVLRPGVSDSLWSCAVDLVQGTISPESALPRLRALKDGSSAERAHWIELAEEASGHDRHSSNTAVPTLPTVTHHRWTRTIEDLASYQHDDDLALLKRARAMFAERGARWVIDAPLDPWVYVRSALRSDPNLYLGLVAELCHLPEYFQVTGPPFLLHHATAAAENGQITLAERLLAEFERSLQPATADDISTTRTNVRRNRAQAKANGKPIR